MNCGVRTQRPLVFRQAGERVGIDKSLVDAATAEASAGELAGILGVEPGPLVARPGHEARLIAHARCAKDAKGNAAFSERESSTVLALRRGDQFEMLS